MVMDKYYCNYHKHSDYSNTIVKDSVTTIDDYCNRAIELGHKEVFTTEHGYQGFPLEWINAANKYGLKVIEGAEVYYVDNRLKKKSRGSHLIIIALNNDGAKELNRIISESFRTGFHYRPRIDKELLLSLTPTNVIVTTACMAGKWDDRDFILMCKKHFGNNFYLEVQNHNNEMQKRVNETVIEFSKAFNIKLIHANDSHYIYPDDAKYRDLYIKAKRSTNKKKGSLDETEEIENSCILDYPDYDTIFYRYKEQGVLSDEQIKEALDNTNVFRDCEGLNYFNKKIKLPCPYENPKKELRKIIKKEFNRKKNELDFNKYNYLNELKNELKTIEDCNMSAYFVDDYYIVKNGIEKYGGIVTNTGRGSCVSFFTNYILGFTKIDRVKTKIPLYPSRFMSTTRILKTVSLPDIDLNVDRREPFIKASEDLLGKDNCKWMISFKPLQNSSAFRLLCKALGFEPKEYDNIAKDLDSYKDNKKWKDIIEESKKFIGVIDTWSPSPCSMLLFNKPIEEEVGTVCVKDKKNGEMIELALLDGYNCDKWKYLKNDILNVLVISIYNDTFKLAGVKTPTINELEELIYKDDKTWKIYEKGLTCTINQADSEFGTQCAMRYKPKTVEEMSAFVAILRPGCASLRDDFLDRKPYSTGVKELDDLLVDGSGRMIYQELIMKYLIWLGIEESETYGIIKKISKKKFKHDELEELKKTLKNGWIKQVGKEDGFENTWEIVEDAARYSFNASHSESYAYDSIYQAYAKSHYPIEYYTVALNYYEDDIKRTNKLIEEMKYFDIQLKPIEFGKSLSEYSFDRETNTIYKGIGSIKYMNDSVPTQLNELYNKNKYSSFVDLYNDICKYTNINETQIKGLIILGYFKAFGKSNKLMKIKNLFDKVGNLSIIRKENIEDYGLSEFAVRKYTKKETEKQYRGLDGIGIVKYMADRFEDKNVNIIYQIKEEIDYLGKAVYKNEKFDKNIYIVIDEVKGSKPYVNIYSLRNGENVFVKFKSGYDEAPFQQFSILHIDDIKEEKRWIFLGNDERGKPKFKQDDNSFQKVVRSYSIIKY